MNDEIIEQNYRTPVPLQENIIRQYCTGIDTKIGMAKSRSDAVSIVETACHQFKSSCESEILLSALRHHLMAVVNNEWKNQ